MAIRKILVPLSSVVAGEAAFSAALVVARVWNAHISAVHVRVDSRDVAPLAGEGLSGAMIEEMMTATEKESAARAGLVHAMFHRYVTEQNIPIGEARPGLDRPTASFAAVIGREEELIAQQARLADLTVVARPSVGEDVSSSDTLHAVLFDSGRPVLLAPPACPQSMGQRICVAWNGTAESASAVSSALAWLKKAAAVRILSADEYQRRGPAAQDLADYLMLHGVAAELAMFRPIDREVGAGLLAAAHEFGADLLCMGAYSHSRLRQLILGGVTRYVLEHADLPVLLKH
jgi:nucleotide-binding universal stress UspA family protein